jgi:hypothetical protein
MSNKIQRAKERGAWDAETLNPSFDVEPPGVPGPQGGFPSFRSVRAFGPARAATFGRPDPAVRLSCRLGIGLSASAAAPTEPYGGKSHGALVVGRARASYGAASPHPGSYEPFSSRAALRRSGLPEPWTAYPEPQAPIPAPPHDASRKRPSWTRTCTRKHRRGILSREMRRGLSQFEYSTRG